MQYCANTSTLTIAEGKTRVLLAVVSTAAIGFQVIEIGVSFNGTTVNEPCRIDLFKSNRSTNFTLGTKNTEITLYQSRGAGNSGKQSEAIAATVKAAEAFSEAEPPLTTEVLKSWFVSPTAGFLYQAPLGREIEAVPSATAFALGIQVTSAKAVNARTYMEIIQGPS